MPTTLPPPLRRLAVLDGPGRALGAWGAAGLGLALLVLAQGAGLSERGPVALFAVNVLAIGACGLLGVLVARPITARPLHPMRALWLPLLAGVAGPLLSYGLVTATGGVPARGARTGLGAEAGLQVIGLALVEVVVAAVLLASLRALVLFRRTRASEQRWRLMLGAMAAASLVLALAGPDRTPTDVPAHVFLLAVAVVAMTANAFRLSWIVYLSLRQKLAALGMALGLVVLLALALSDRADAGWMGASVFRTEVWFADGLEVPLSALLSQPVSQFVTLAMAFGVLYGVSALLALLFHLPTAGALEQKSGEMEALRALARLSGSVFDRERLVETVAGAPVESGVADAAWLALVRPETGSLRPQVVAAQGLTPAQVRTLVDVEPLVEEALGRGEPLLLRHAPADHRVRARPGDGVGSLLVLPLRVHDASFGALFAARAVSDGFETDDVAALATFAAQAALALHNAVLFAERLERERLQRELAIAREVQRRLLPAQLPSSARLTCAALSLPAQEVAGDYYDVAELGDGAFGLIVADVAGKGTSAAFYMAELKGVFQAIARQTRSPRAFLIRANEALSGSLGRAAFISAVYVVFDEAAGTLTLARAGHCPPALARASGEVRLFRTGGIGLGLSRGPVFARALEEVTVTLEPGDTLVLYTDGLVEARGAGGEEYGYERLAHALGRFHGKPPAALHRALLQDLRRFTGTAAEDAWDDDLTLVTVTWKGIPAATTADGSAAPTPASLTVSP